MISPLTTNKEIVMLEHYFVKPGTIDRIRASWIGEPTERYVAWLHDHRYSARIVHRRVPLLMQFGEFAKARGAKAWADLPNHLDSFTAHWVREHEGDSRTDWATKGLANFARNPIQQLFQQLLPDYSVRGSKQCTEPLVDRAPGFFDYLRRERGLRNATLKLYFHSLRRLERYLQRIGLVELVALSPAVLSAFVRDSSRDLAKPGLKVLCSHLRVFMGYLHRQGLVARDLDHAIEAPASYRLADIPRSISWGEVRRLLESLDRRDALGKRDYAILLLLVTYGLRAREVAELTLDDIDWKRERLNVPERKCGHSTAYPLSSIVGEALIEYIRHARPPIEDRKLFFQATAPYPPLTSNAISQRVSRYLRKANIPVTRPGSHTLRHSCVQRLVDANLDLKTIGDYVGHRSPASTEIYTKVAVETLRDVALGDGEEVL
jgi:integrase/recombinase XerD